VGAVAAVIMLGRHVPVVAHLLHGLPIVGVLRGPARHNFELALATSVLGAYGIDVARRAGGGSMRRWFVGVAVFALASYAAVRYANAGHVSEDAAIELLHGVTLGAAVGGAVAFALFVVALRFREARAARGLWAAVAVLPLFETAWAMRVEAHPNRSAIGLVEAAERSLPNPRGVVRLLSVSLFRGSADDFAGNSVLFHSGVESLQGYSSIAYSAARDVLDLDMHGQPTEYDELAYSILPSVFGVTHLVLPSTVCESERFSFEPGHEICARRAAVVTGDDSAAPPSSPASGTRLACTAVSSDESPEYRLDAGVRAQASEAAGATLSFLRPPTWEKRVVLEVEGSSIVPNGVRLGRPFRLGSVESWGGFMLENLRSTEVEFFDVGLSVERDVAVASLEPLDRAELAAERVDFRTNAIRLTPGDGGARVGRRVHWPKEERPSSGVATLEVEARATSEDPHELVVDLYRDPGYDPEDAQIVVSGRDLALDWRVFRKEIRIDGAPEEFTLRTFVLGGGPIEIAKARLVVRRDEQVYGFPNIRRYAKGARFDGDRIVVDPKTKVVGGMHLPVRPFEVLLDADVAEHEGGPIRFGFDLASAYDVRRAWDIEKPLRVGRVRVRHVAVIPPDEPSATLFAQADGAAPLRVNELSAADACTLRGYRNPKRLSDGLFLYENPFALPRAYTVAATVRADDPLAARRALLDFEPSDLGRKAVVGREVPADLAAGSVENATFTARSADVTVTTAALPTLLVVNERFDPDWRATIDGAPVAILPVNGIVRGVIVPAGTHRVHFAYRTPTSVWLGVALAIAGVLAALIVAPKLRRATDSAVQNNV
jgi:hypothetical protein